MIIRTPLVYIVILNYNGLKDTVECIESLQKITYKNYKIIIVDNNSIDNSEEILRQKFPNYKFIQTGENLGFAGGNNVGIKHALKANAEYILLLNNDTIVEKSFLEPLVETAESAKDIGVVGGKIYYNDSGLIWYAGANLNQYTGKTQHFGDREKDSGQYNNIRETGYVTGCLMLIKRSAIEKAGLMDDSYFLYYEETDWNVRIKKLGYRLIYNYNSVIYHKVSSTTKNINEKMKYYYDRNVNYFINKNFGLSNRLFMYGYIRIRLLLKLFKAGFLRDKNKMRVIKDTYRDIRLKRMGEYK
jgi:GT2 family glycosyltransferase